MRVPSGERILEIFNSYIRINSESFTEKENLAGAFFHSFFEDKPYFKTNPGHLGAFPVADDPLGRKVEWALVRGNGPRTAVLVHHFDVVGVEDFGPLRASAFEPEKLEAALRERAGLLEREAREDLESGAFIFGRGSADMKAGGAMQMALLESFSREDPRQGNILLIAVPDEENLSAGMRSAVDLLSDLKDLYGLEYSMMINSEPHQRKSAGVGVLSGGSIGKILPFAYVRGVLAHAGKSPEGFNPLAVLSEIIRRSEMSLAFSDARREGHEMSPPPTWLSARDSKTSYDVSMPLSAFGCLSVQPLFNRPWETLAKFKKICGEASEDAADRVNLSARAFRERTGRAIGGKSWKIDVYTFSEFLEDAKSRFPEEFERVHREALSVSERGLRGGGLSAAQAAWSLLDAVADLRSPAQPFVVAGFLPPYYPSVSHLDSPGFDAAVRKLEEALRNAAVEEWGQTYELESYFTGISDLSYSSLTNAAAVEDSIRGEMPFYGGYYSIPFHSIARVSMPCMNIGPWGKDFHKATERVSRQDLLERAPALLARAIRLVLRE